MIRGNVYAMCPVDVTDLPTDLGADIPKPSIDHTIKPCDQCGRRCWIGPAQLFQLTFNGGTKVCYWCAAGIAAVSGGVDIVELDHTADQKPRRT